MALSAQVADDTDIGRVIVSRGDPEFVLYRISQRLGLPVHPSWAKWFWAVLNEHQRTKPLDGLGYQPVAVTGTKQEFLEWIGDAVKEKEAGMSLKAKTRERVQPKMGKVDIDYQKLHDAFFKFQTKPAVTGFGEM